MKNDLVKPLSTLVTPAALVKVVIFGISAAFVLGGIWYELKENRKTLVTLTEKATEQSAKLSTMNSMMITQAVVLNTVSDRVFRLENNQDQRRYGDRGYGSAILTNQTTLPAVALGKATP